MKNQFSKDLYRFYGEEGEPFYKRLLRPAELKYIALFRKANACRFRPLKAFYTLRLKIMSNKTYIQIPARTKIGEGFYIGHSGSVVINPDAVLGKNMNMTSLEEKYITKIQPMNGLMLNMMKKATGTSTTVAIVIHKLMESIITVTPTIVTTPVSSWLNV